MAATGFALAMALRASPSRRPVIWIEEESASSEYGGLYPPGLHAFGINPSRLLIVRCPTAQDVLKAANDALEEASGKASNLISGVVASVSGQPKCLDLTASRRLLLATETAHLPVILLRSHQTGVQSAAVSRWRVAPASSRSSGANAPGKPVFPQFWNAIDTAPVGNGSWNGTMKPSNLEQPNRTADRVFLALWFPFLPTDRLRNNIQHDGTEKCRLSSPSARPMRCA